MRPLVLLHVLICLLALASSQPRPSWPQYFHVTSGNVACLWGTGGPPCVAPMYGVMSGWYQFDDDGNFQNYREDAVIENTTLVYNRELATPTSSSEYFLLDGATALQCVEFPNNITLNRNFLQNATYAGSDTINGVDVHAFKGNWTQNGKPYPVTAWVRKDTGAPYGWESLPVQYVWNNVQVLTTIDPSVFARPNITCMTPKF